MSSEVSFTLNAPVASSKYFALVAPIMGAVTPFAYCHAKRLWALLFQLYPLQHQLNSEKSHSMAFSHTYLKRKSCRWG